MEQDAPTPPLGPWQGIEESHWRAFFGKSADYYAAQLARLQQGRWAEFSVPAFFLGFLWMAYRRMYMIILAAIILFAIEGTLEVAILSWFGATERFINGADLLMRCVVGIAIGTFANRVYLWDARRQIREELAKGPFHIEELILARLAKRGGTSWMFILLIFGVFALAMIALNFLDFSRALD